MLRLNFRAFLLVVSVFGIVFPFIPARAKSQQECIADYNANRERIVASGQTRKGFVASCVADRLSDPAIALPPPPALKRQIPAGGIMSLDH